MEKFGADKGSGGLWNNRPGKGWLPIEYADKPFGEWNQFKIKMVDDLVTVYLNEKARSRQQHFTQLLGSKTPLESVCRFALVQLITNSRRRNSLTKHFHQRDTSILL